MDEFSDGVKSPVGFVRRLWRRIRGRCGGCGAKRHWRRFPRMGVFKRHAWPWYHVCSHPFCAGHYHPGFSQGQRECRANTAWRAVHYKKRK